METDPPTAPAEAAAAPTPLNQRNWMNLGAYILNVVITYGVGVFGTAGETNEYLSLKYQTLVTPAGWAFSIWAVIFVAELCFVAAQMTAEFRGSKWVQDGVRNWFVGACAAQVLWTVAFSYEYISISFLFMLCLCYALVEILKAQYAMEGAGEEAAKEYWLLRFPFEIHAGWIIAASFVSLNVWCVSLNASNWLLIGVAAVSLVGIMALAVASVWYLFRPIFPVGVALTWAVIGVAEELYEPKQSIFNAFTVRTINAFRISATFLATFLCIVVMTRGVKKYLKERANEMDLCGSGDGGGSSGDRDIASDFVKVEDDRGFVKVDADQV